MTRRALTFGSVASAYEQFRPSYPDELIDAVIAYAGRQVRAALEIGAGTGKATRAFAGRGIVVTATDPDQAMLDELQKHLPAVAVVQASFEDLPLRPVFDLVFAAASLHWTAPERRWSRLAAMLTPDGVFASFGGPMHLADPVVADAVRAARSDYLASDDVPPPDGSPADSAMHWPGTELITSGLFDDVRQVQIERRVTMSASGYVGHLSTVSAYLLLPVAVRAEVFDRVLRVMPERVELIADLTLHLARKA